MKRTPVESSESVTRRRMLRLSPGQALATLLLVATGLLWSNVQLVNVTSLPNKPSIPFVPKQHSNKSPRNINYTDGAAACLLVMDDNHRLIEWLAYHYHTLPLRYLVIAVDPRSQTQPDKILQRWNATTNKNNKNNNKLTIIHWRSDADYMTPHEMERAQNTVRRFFRKDQPSESLVRHRARQRIFYMKCLQHCQQQGRHWTAIIDTDEYLALNYQTIQRHYQRRTLAPQQSNKQGTNVPPTPPPITQPGSILTFLQQELERPDAFANITSPCLQIPRIRFGAKESRTEQVQQQVPTAFNGTLWETLRWRWHATEGNYGVNRISKTMLDLSRIDWDDLQQPVDSIHRPIQNLCGRRKLHIRKSEQALVIHHYLGTLEHYNFRNDARQGKERSEKVRQWVFGTYVRLLSLSLIKIRTNPALTIVSTGILQTAKH